MPLSVEWLGNAGFRVAHEDGRSLMIDPWLLGNPGATYDIDDAPAADFVVVTHGHPGHFGREADCVQLSKRFGKPLVSSTGVCEYAQELEPSIETIVIDPGHGLRLWADCTLVAFVAPHSPIAPGVALGDAPGEPNMGFLLTWDQKSVMHIGDALPDPVFGGLRGTGTVDLACLPSWTPNMHEPEDVTIGELVEICGDVKPAKVYPHCRYDSQLETSGKLQDALTAADVATEVVWGPPGTRFEL